MSDQCTFKDGQVKLYMKDRLLSLHDALGSSRQSRCIPSHQSFGIDNLVQNLWKAVQRMLAQVHSKVCVWQHILVWHLHAGIVTRRGATTLSTSNKRFAKFEMLHSPEQPVTTFSLVSQIQCS